MSTPVQQGKLQPNYTVSQNTGIIGKKAHAQLKNQVGNVTLGHKTIKQTAINSRVSTAKKAKAQLNNHVGNGTLGHKTMGQTAVNDKVSTAKRPKPN